MRFLFFSLALLLLARLEATEDLPLPVYSPDLATKAELNDPVAQFEIGRCFAPGLQAPKWSYRPYQSASCLSTD